MDGLRRGWLGLTLSEHLNVPTNNRVSVVWIRNVRPSNDLRYSEALRLPMLISEQQLNLD
jgi:hypothetical protein